MMVGPFDLVVDSMCCLLGIGLGAGALWVALFLSAGSPEAGADRADLLEVLTVEHELDIKQALKIAESALSPWARLRKKTNPILWAFGWKWPEYAEISREEFAAHYDLGLPESDHAPATPDEALSDLDLELQGEYLEEWTRESLPTGTLHATMHDSDESI